MKKIVSMMFVSVFMLTGIVSLNASELENKQVEVQPTFYGNITTTASPGLCSQTKTFAQTYAQGNTTSYVSGSKSKGVTETWFQLHTTSGDVQALVGANASWGRYSAKADSGYMFGSKANITGTHYASGY